MMIIYQRLYGLNNLLVSTYIWNEAPSDVYTLLVGSAYPRWKMSRFTAQNTIMSCQKPGSLSSGTSNAICSWWSLIICRVQKKHAWDLLQNPLIFMPVMISEKNYDIFLHKSKLWILLETNIIIGDISIFFINLNEKLF